MLLLKTKQGIVICSKTDFKSFMISKGILIRGEIVKENRWKMFYRDSTKKVHNLHENWWAVRNPLYFNLNWNEVIDWYDFDNFLYRNAEEIVKLIDEGKLKVYDANLTKLNQKIKNFHEEKNET